ncbi:MAG: SDR family NAD(P)-dependent oxidoreductase, partial [Actinomycetes bacterium]
MMDSFAGVRALVTGGASGIGAAVAAALTARGARVAVLDLRTATLPDGAVGFTCDVGDPASVDSAVAAAAEHLGGIDVVINNAGVGAAGSVADNDDDDLGLGRFDFKRIGGGLLVQTFDEMEEDRDKLQPVTQR